MAYPSFGINNLRQQNLFDDYGMSSPYMDQSYGQSGGFYEDPPITEQTPPYQGPSFDPSLFHQGMPTFGRGGDSPTSYFQTIMDAMNKGYTPDTQASERLNSLLSSAPNISDYSPGFGRKLTASLAGWKGGPEVADKIMYAPYAHDMADWNAKVAPYQAASSAENARNIQERTLVSNAATTAAAQYRADQQAQAAQTRADETARHNMETERNNTALTRLRQFKLDHPDWIFKDTGDTIVAFDPQNPQKNYDTGFKTKDMDPMTKMIMGAMLASVVKSVEPGAAPKPPTAVNPRNEPIEQQNRMRNIFMTGESDAKWIKQNDDGSFSMKDRPVPGPGGMFSSAVPQSDLDEWKAVLQKVLGTSNTGEVQLNILPKPAGGRVPQTEGQTMGQFTPIPGTGSSSQVPNQSRINESANTGQMLEVRNPKTGETGYIPATQASIEDAKRKGWLIKTPGGQ